MNTDPEHAMSFEEQFVAFSGRAGNGTDTLASASPAEHQPAALAAVPAVEEVASEPAWVVPEDSTPVEAAPSAAIVATYAVEDEQTDSMLADLERATESLSRFRGEIGRLVQFERATSTELSEARQQIASLQQQLADYPRLENELAQERARIAAVRARLAEVIQTLDIH
jgi:septal ring factor EnvC (AmiA/AmiB activator)